MWAVEGRVPPRKRGAKGKDHVRHRTATRCARAIPSVVDSFLTSAGLLQFPVIAMQNQRIRNSWLLVFFTDFVAIVAAYYVTFAFRLHSGMGERFYTFVNRLLKVREVGDVGRALETFYMVSAPRIILILTCVICFFYAICGLYEGRRFVRRRPVAWDVIVANASALLVFFVYFYLRRNVWHPRSYFATFVVFNVFFCVGLRSLTASVWKVVYEKIPGSRQRAVLIGLGEETAFIEGLISAENPDGIYISERIRTDPGKDLDGVLKEVERAAREKRADLLILVDREFSVAGVMRLLEVAAGLDLPAKVLSDKLDVLMNQAGQRADLIHGAALVHFDAPSVADRYAGVRHALGRVLAVAALIVLSPLLAVIALLVVATSRGGPFFIQERIGVNRKPFSMFKFRTMWHRSDELQAQVEEFNESGAGLFKIRKDSRVTPIGRFLRRFSLDEVPQFLNVVRGEMTWVGPRPLPRRDFENYYEEWHYSRHAGMPGLTCLWQVSGRSDLDFHSMCILDVYYLRNRNWIMDLRIILRTFWAVLFAKGAY